jgi:hypothetical protein
MVAMTGNFDEVINKLEADARDADDSLDRTTAREYRQAASSIRDWVAAGQNGNCPVNLEKYGLKGDAPVAHPTKEPLHEQKQSDVEKHELQSALGVDTPDNPDESLTDPQVSEKAETHLESPEIRDLRKGLKEVRKAIKEERLREAVALILALAPRLSASDLAEEAQPLEQEAKSRFDAALQQALERGNRALEDGMEEDARRAYQTVLDSLDGENAHARAGLRKLDKKGQPGQALSESDVLRLSGDLKDRRNIKRLGAAVYEAEALDAESRLPANLDQLAQDARQAYNGLRRAMGEETTMMHFDNLEGRKKARDLINDRIGNEEEYVFDVVRGTEVPIYELLNTANQLLLERSQETAQHEMDVVRQLLPAHPLAAEKRLKEALQKPFHEEHTRTLQTKLEEVKALGESQARAEALLSKAGEETDEVRAFTLALQAQGAFEYLPELKMVLQQTRQRALGTVQRRMAAALERARVNLRMGKYVTAREEVNKLLEMPEAWPEYEKPDEFGQVIADANSLLAEIGGQESAKDDFDQKVAQIRARVVGESSRGQALDLFDQVKVDPKFAHFSELGTLISEMDAYRGIDQKVQDIQSARQDGDWERVYQLTQKIRQEGKSGQFAEQVNIYYEEAEQELAIESARRDLENFEVLKANKILTRMLAEEQNPARKIELKQRVRHEMDQIDHAINDKEQFRPLFELAQEMRNKSIPERVKALKITRLIAGLNIDAPEDNWPPYRLTLLTADARRQAYELSQQYRQEWLPPLEEAYQYYVIGEKKEAGGKKKNEPESTKFADGPLSEEKLRSLAERALALQDANLLVSGLERDIVRWVDVEWGKRQAQAREKSLQWPQAVAIWNKLDLNYPNTPQVEMGLRCASIQQTLTDARRWLYQDHNNSEALNILVLAQENPILSASWELWLMKAEIHARMEDFDQAFGAIGQAEQYPDGRSETSAKRVEIEREHVISDALVSAEKKWVEGDYRASLLALKTGLETELARDSRRLRDRREKIFEGAKSVLLKSVKEERASGSEDGKIKAIIDLVDLRDLEELAEVTLSQRRSTGELTGLKSDLETAARALMSRATQFDINLPQMELGQAILEADHLAGRFQMFWEVVPLFENELGEIKKDLKTRRVKIGETYDKLKRLKTILDDASSPKYWESALQLNNFGDLEEKLKSARDFGLNQMVNVRRFEQRLLEWQETHAYIMQELASLKREFEVDEDFDKVIQHLKRLRTSPSMRSDGEAWQFVQQKQYEEIISAMEAKFRIVDVWAEGDLSGRNAIEVQAGERLEEFESWHNWQKNCERVRQSLQDALDKVSHYESVGQPQDLASRQHAWQNVADRARDIINSVDGMPQKNSDTVPVRSQKTQDIFDLGKKYRQEGERYKAEAEKWVNELRENIDQHSGFPDEDEFMDATHQRDLPRLAKLLERAEIIGTSDGQQRKLHNHYANVYKKLQDEEKRQGGLRGLISRMNGK